MEDGNDLAKLISAYVAAEPNRSRGGIVALTGFEYQIWSYLADFAIALTSGDLLAGGEKFAHSFETLSDYTRAFGTKIVCVQVKHHLTAHHMAVAGAEFAAIDRFLASYPALDQNLISFEVVARTGIASPKWETIQLPRDVQAREPDLVVRFDQLRRSGRLLAPRFEPDPQWKFISSVYKHLTDPFGFARRAFALCMRRSREPSSAALVREAIAEDFVANSSDRVRASRTLTDSDFIPDAGDTGVSLARTPTLRDLRAGRFMPRSRRVAEFLEAVDELHRRHVNLDEPAIPVMWIDGRSGCGKSVLLLQAMERLVLDRKATVVWFSSGASELDSLVEQMAETEASLRPDFLVLDDIYDPQARDELDLIRLSRIVITSERTDWPMLITCGPTEFRQDFERACRAEGFHVYPWHLSTLEDKETIELRQWFQSRTGRLSQPGPAAKEQRALMVSVMFELEHGDLRPFAHRFRNRLAQDQLDSALTIPLALNRLYIWTPRRWLSTDQQARLERLNQDGDFSVLSVEGRGKDLFKLTHPHLSDAIYRAIHPEAIPTTFATHLATGFSKGLSSHPATAFRILKAVVSNTPRLDIVDQDELIEQMTAAWNESDQTTLPPEMAADVWVDWARWASRQPVVGISLAASPLERAAKSLYNSHPRWSFLWANLWTCEPGEPTLVTLALDWLVSYLEADGWYFVWSRVTEHSIQNARLTNRSREEVNRLAQLGAEWLKASSHKRGWAKVWEQLANASDLLPLVLYNEIIDLGLAWVSQVQTAKSWNFVWERLIDLFRKKNPAVVAELYALGIKWLGENQNHAAWAFVWEYFMDLPMLPSQVTRDEMVQLGLDWSAGRERDPAWFFVTSKLVDDGNMEAQERFLERSIGRVEQTQSSPYWPSDWHSLFGIRKRILTSDQRRRLFNVARQWVTSDDEREGVLFVLAIMLSAEGISDRIEEMDLVNRACQALSRTVETDDRSWEQLWFAVGKRIRTWQGPAALALHDMLRDLGRRWLGKPEHLNTGTWSQVYSRAYRIGIDPEGSHRDLAIKGIVQGLVPDTVAFATLLYSHSRLAPPDEIIQFFDRWFAGPASQSGGFSVWARLDRATREALSQSRNIQWTKIRDVLDRHRPRQESQWETVVEHYRQNQPIVGRVVKTVLLRKKRNQTRRLGYVVDIGTNAFLALEEAGLGVLSERARLGMVGKSLEFDIIRLDETTLQVDLSRRTFLLRRMKEILNDQISDV